MTVPMDTAVPTFVAVTDSPCNKRSGHCDGGCNPGYTNIDCNKGKFSLETYQGLVILCN